MADNDNPLTQIKALRCNLKGMDPAWRSLLDAPDELTREGLRLAFMDYVQTRDLQRLQSSGALLPDVVPVLFSIRRLPAMFLLNDIGNEPTEDRRRLRAFRAACHSVSQGDTLLGAVTRAKGDRFCGTNDHGLLIAPESWVEWIAEEFGLGTVTEMGQIALDLARARKSETAPFSYWGGSVAEHL